MIQVDFTTFELDPDTKRWIELRVAQLLASDDAVTISGPHADWIDPDLAIIDPETAQRVTRAEGAERWARLQPFAYRSGDFNVRVTEVAATQPAGATSRSASSPTSPMRCGWAST